MSHAPDPAIVQSPAGGEVDGRRLLGEAVGFGRALRRAGLSIDLGAAVDYARALTLVEAEAVEELRRVGIAIDGIDTRRNLVVSGIDLDALIGRRFRIGAVECFGARRCEPCAHLQRLTEPGVLRGLVHRGGLRADLLSDGEIRTGDEVVALP